MSDVKIIAELGINHNHDMAVLRCMVEEAKASGVDYVKIQKRDVPSCYSEEDLAKPCSSPWGTTVGDKVRGRELSWDDVNQLNLWCREFEIEWFASCFDLKSLRELHDYFPVRPFNKVPSAMALHEEFLETVAAQEIMTLISTGLCKDYQHVHEVIGKFEGKCSYVINHCVALYPCPNDRLNLNNISELQSEFGGIFLKGIGYSGHETGVLPSVIAAQLGATYIERHFTLDRTMYGADQAASLEPDGLRRLVRDIHSLPTILGSAEKKLHGDEKIPVRRPK